MNGLTFTPDAEYFNMLPGDPQSLNPATITITTDDGNLDTPPVGQFAGPTSPVETDTDTIPIDVVAVNDPPSFTTPVIDPPAIDEDAAPVVIPGFVTGMTAGPQPSEQAQTYSFIVDAPVIVSGTLQFLPGQEPAIDVNGQLTYAVAPDTNGQASVTFRLRDANASDPNHVPADSPDVTFLIDVNAINDEPTLTLLTTVVDGVEDEGPRGPIDLVSSAAAGPPTALDEIAAPPAGQTLTFMSTAPVIATGNLTFVSFSVSPIDGTLSFEATPNTSGTATFNIWVQDDGSTANAADDNSSAVQTVTISVAAQPDPPVPATLAYTIDEGTSLTLDASGSTDPDIAFPGDSLTYAWDLNNDGTYDRTGETSPVITIPWSELGGLGLTAPGTNTVTLRVTDTFNGTSVTTTTSLDILTVDYGDAPDTFKTLRASNGAAHTIVSGFQLGATVVNDLDGLSGNTSDNDGIVFEAGMQADSAIDIGSYFTANASAAGKLDVWIDFNNNGTFEPAEKLNGGNSYDLQAGDNLINFTILAGQATTGVDTWVRARFSSAGGLTPSGRAADGEVEDYIVNFSPLLDPVAVESVLPMWSQTSDSTPLIQWQQVAGTPPGSNATYNIELRNALGQVVGFEENYTGNSITITDSLPPGVYTPFITPINRAGVSLAPIGLASFEVVALAVSTPTGRILDNTPTVQWNSVTQTDHYHLQIRSSINGQLVLEELNLPGDQTTYDVQTALNIGTYQVRVRAIEDVTGQLGDWSPFQNFTIATAPSITAPANGTSITTASPTITWNSIPGAATYELQLIDVTDNINPLLTLTGLTTTSATLTTPLELGEYSVAVRGVTADPFVGDWSPVSRFTVTLPSTISQPIDRLPDATPTIVWTAVAGAENYTIEIVDTASDAIVHTVPGLTTTQYTLPNDKALPLGRYELRIKANNLPAAGTSATTVTSISTPAIFFVTAPPEVLLPNVGIYDTTPTITWNSPLGTRVSEVEVVLASTGAVVYTATDVAGSSLTIPDAQKLVPGEYRVRVRSYANAPATLASDWSTVHVFQVGRAPILLGPSTGLAAAKPFYSIVDQHPTLTWQQSLAGETFSVWLSDASNGKTIRIVHNLNTASYTFSEDTLPVGRYRYWARATTGLGEQSAWSVPFEFEVKTRPVVVAVGPSFDTTPTFSWNTPATGNLQPEIDEYEVFVRRVDVKPVQDFVFTTSGTSFTIPDDQALANGRYRVWVRGTAIAAVNGVPATRTIWSLSQDFEISGRPIVTTPGNTTDSTPLISWSAVGEAASYQLYIAPATTPGTPLLNLSGLTSTSYQLSTALPNGSYVAWVRATSNAGTKSPWSLTTQGQFTISGSTVPSVDRVEIDPIATSNDRTPTFTWTAVANVAKYDLFVASVADSSTALIRDTNIAATATSYTAANRPLAPGDYRVWVRVISTSGVIGAWSAPVRFTITANSIPLGSELPVNSLPMLASLEAISESLNSEDVTVSLIPAVVVADSGRQVSETQTNIADTVTRQNRTLKPTEAAVAQVADLPEGSADADELMSAWDAAIWAEESGEHAAIAVEPTTEPAVRQETAETGSSTGWLASLALFSGSLLRRRRREE
ncbi:MAG: GEVED domain-containing protein [Planctomycetaceae bacterium]